MRISLLPKIIVSATTDLSAQFLKERNIRLLMMDFDNTIVPYTCDVPTEKMDAWLKEMQASDIQLCIVSNTKRDRVNVFCAPYGIPVITHAAKPFGKGIDQCVKRFGVDSKQCALVGDQIFTDTLGANLNGVTSILVPAINNHNFWLKLRHVAELPFIFFARKRRVSL